MWYWLLYLLLCILSIIKEVFLWKNYAKNVPSPFIYIYNQISYFTIEQFKEKFHCVECEKNLYLELLWYGSYNHLVQKYKHRSETKNIVWNTVALFQAFAFSRHWKHEKIVSTFWISARVSLTTAKIFPGWRGQRIY